MSQALSSDSSPPLPSRPLEIQIYADLHLEMGHPTAPDYFKVSSPSGTKSGKLPVNTDYLFLAGDIGSLVLSRHRSAFRGWLEKMCQQFEYVFYVAGNHEFYSPSRTGNGIAKGLEQMRKYEQEPSMDGRLICLENEGLDIPGTDVTVLGCVLWSRLMTSQKGLADLGDVSSIAGTSFNEHCTRFENSIEFLRDEVAAIRADPQKSENRIVVLTHYCPLMLGSTAFEYQGAWSNWQTDIIGGQGVIGLGKGDVWIHGHTHFSHETLQDEVRVISNSRGSGQGEPSFNWEGTYTI